MFKSHQSNVSQNQEQQLAFESNRPSDYEEDEMFSEEFDDSSPNGVSMYDDCDSVSQINPQNFQNYEIIEIKEPIDENSISGKFWRHDDTSFDNVPFMSSIT